MARSRRKISLKKVLCLILVVIVAFMVIGGISSFAKNDKVKLSDFSFAVGGLSETDGKYVKCKDKLYTKNAIECQGLTVVPDFECTAEYQIFWYNEDDIYFGHTEVMTEKFIDNVPECAAYCRIMVIPSNLDENGKAIKDFEIKFYEKYKYVNTLTVKVDKEQSWNPIDYYQEALLKKAPQDHVITSIDENYLFYENKYFLYNSSGTTSFVDGVTDFDQNHCVVKLNCEDWGKIQCLFNEIFQDEHQLQLVYFNEEGIAISNSVHKGAPGSSFVDEVPEGAKYVIFNTYESMKPFEIYKYLPRISE